MGLILVLLITISFLWVFCVLIRKDIFCSCAIICESYIIAIFSAIYNYKKWEMNFHLNTFWVILIGLLLFLFVSAIYNYKLRAIKDFNINKEEDKRTIKFIAFKKNNIIIILTMISMIIAFFYFNYFFKAINSFPVESFSQKMEMYRNKTVYQGIVYIPTVVNFLSKICRAIAIVYSYIIINNFLYNNIKKVHKKDLNTSMYFTGIFIYILMTVCSGARFDIVIFLIACIVIWYVLYNRYSSKKIDFLKIIKLFFIFALVVIIFVQSKALFGRNNNSNKGLDYFTQYFGGSMHCFDVYLHEERHENVFGQEIFAGIRKFLYQIHVLDEMNASKDVGKFIYMKNGDAVGNIYSAYRHMYHDFGYIGIAFFQIVLAIIFNVLYHKYVVYKLIKENEFIIDYKLILYSVTVFCLFLHSYSEFFFSTILSFNYITLFIFIKFILIVLEKSGGCICD